MELGEFVGFYYFWGFYFCGGSGFGGSGFVGFGYRFGGVVGVVHCAFEVADGFAHGPAYVAEFAWAEYHQND